MHALCRGTAPVQHPRGQHRPDGSNLRRLRRPLEPLQPRLGVVAHLGLEGGAHVLGVVLGSVPEGGDELDLALVLRAGVSTAV